MVEYDFFSSLYRAATGFSLADVFPLHEVRDLLFPHQRRVGKKKLLNLIVGGASPGLNKIIANVSGVT